MPRVDKTLVILTKQDALQIKSAVERRDKKQAFLLLRDVLGKKIELMLKRRCK
jgi:hypothetical protein